MLEIITPTSAVRTTVMRNSATSISIRDTPSSAWRCHSSLRTGNLVLVVHMDQADLIGLTHVIGRYSPDL